MSKMITICEDEWDKLEAVCITADKVFVTHSVGLDNDRHWAALSDALDVVNVARAQTRQDAQHNNLTDAQQNNLKMVPLRCSFCDHHAVEWECEICERRGADVPVSADSRQCRKCGSTMDSGKAIAQTWVEGMPDFPGQKHGITLSLGGPGELVDVMKCTACGWSVSAEQGLNRPKPTDSGCPHCTMTRNDGSVYCHLCGDELNDLAQGGRE